MTHYADTWSRALQLPLNSLLLDNDSLKLVAEKVGLVIYAARTQETLGSVNAMLEQFHQSERLKVNLEGVTVDDTVLLAHNNVFPQLTKAMKEEWPQEWGDDLTVPLLINLSYVSVMREGKSSSEELTQIAAMITSQFIKTNGLQALHDQAPKLPIMVSAIVTAVAHSGVMSPEQFETFGAYLRTVNPSTRPSLQDLIKEMQSIVQRDNTLAQSSTPS